MNLKKVAIIIVLTIVLSMTFMILNPTLAQTNDDQRQKAETLINILDTVKTSTEEAFSKLNALNISVPPNAETRYQEGIAHAEEAVNLMSEENYSEASSEAVEAMQKFEETLRILQETSPEEPTETEIIAQKAISLKANITRAYEYIESLENLTSRAATAGYNTVAIERKLSEVKKHLEDASDELDKMNLDGAAEKLRTASTSLDELKELYDRLVNHVKESNTEKYLEEAEIRVSTSKANIALSPDLSPQNKTRAITALNNSEINLENARELIDKQRVDEAIEKLEEAKKWEEESKRVLEPVAVTPNSVDAVDKSPKRIETTRPK